MADFTQVLLDTSDRVSTRWSNALAEIRKAKYGPNEWMRDAVGFWLDDIADVWLGVGRGAEVLLLTKNNMQSDKISVRNLTSVKLTKLGQLGGTKTIQLDLLATPAGGSSQKGTVIVAVPAGLSGTTTGEQYAGLLYEDQTPIAVVNYLEL